MTDRRAADRKYERTAKGRERQRRYRLSHKRKAVQLRYNNSPKARIAKRRYDAAHRDRGRRNEAFGTLYRDLRRAA